MLLELSSPRQAWHSFYIFLSLGFILQFFSVPLSAQGHVIDKCEQEASEASLAETDQESFLGRDWTGKTVIFDTNVLIEEPEAIFRFPGATIVLPLEVLKEIDSFKRERNSRGVGSRKISRILEQIMETPTKSGFQVNDNTVLIVPTENIASQLPKALQNGEADNDILNYARHYQKQDHDVIIVSQDRNLRIKANVLKVEVTGYSLKETDAIETIKYKGYHELEVDSGVIADFRSEGTLDPSVLPHDDWKPNEFAVLRSEGTPPLIGRYHKKPDEFRVLANLDQFPLPIRPKNPEQAMAMDLLLDPRIDVITLEGRAGTGKTFLALAAALGQSVFAKRPLYDQILLVRDISPTGKDPGAMPGGVEEKFGPFLAGLYDNLDEVYTLLEEDGWLDNFIRQQSRGPLEQAYNDAEEELTRGRRKGKRRRGPPRQPQTSEEGPSPMYSKKWVLENYLKIQPISFIRGRSISRKIIIVDEAQNLDSVLVETILTRAGRGTKVIFVGNWQQIDVPHLSIHTSGFTELTGLFLDELSSGHVALQTSERSNLAEIAARKYQEQRERYQKGRH